MKPCVYVFDLGWCRGKAECDGALEMAQSLKILDDLSRTVTGKDVPLFQDAVDNAVEYCLDLLDMETFEQRVADRMAEIAAAAFSCKAPDDGKAARQVAAVTPQVSELAPQVGQVEPSEPVVEPMAEAPGRVVLTPTEAEAKRKEVDERAKVVAANNEFEKVRDALKAEFQLVYKESGMPRSDILKHCDPPGGLNKEGWFGNRYSGKSWPTQADVDVLKAGIGRAKAALAAPKNGAPAPSAPLRRIHLEWQKAFRCVNMLAHGEPHAKVAERIEGETPTYVGSPLSAEDVMHIEEFFRSQVKALAGALIVSPGEFNALKPVVQDEIKAMADKTTWRITVEYWRDAR